MRTVAHHRSTFVFTNHLHGRIKRSKPWALAVVAALLLSSEMPLHAATYSRSDITPALGQGYDSITGQLRSSCVSVKGTSRETADTRAEYTINHVSDAAQLSNLTQVGLAFSYKAATGSANGSLNWFESRSLSSFVETFLVRSSFLRSEVSADYELKREYRKLRTNDPLRFRRMCGDSFISSYRLGALIQGAITFSARSEAEQLQIRASAGAQASGSAISGDGLLQTVASRNASQLNVKGETVGIGKPFPAAGSELITDALNISSLAMAHPELLSRVSFQTSDYNIFPGLTKPDQGIRLDALTKLAADFALIARGQADLQYLKENPSEFGPFRTGTFAARLTALNTEQGNLWQLSKPCIENGLVSNCQAILARPPIPIPSLRRSVSIGPNPNQLGTQSVCLLRAEEYARISGTGGWYVSERRGQDYFRPIGAGIANALLLPGQPSPTDLSQPRDAGPGGEVLFQIIDCCPGDNAATENFSIKCDYIPFPEDKGSV